MTSQGRTPVEKTLIEAVADFLDDFETIFDHDWATTEGWLKNPKSVIAEGGTFLRPGKEETNWANRPALLRSYQKLAAAMETVGRGTDIPGSRKGRRTLDASKAKYTEALVLSLLQLGPLSPARIWDLFQWAQTAICAQGTPRVFTPASITDVFDAVRRLKESGELLEINVRSGGENHQLFVLPDPTSTNGKG